MPYVISDEMKDRFARIIENIGPDLGFFSHELEEDAIEVDGPHQHAEGFDYYYVVVKKSGDEGIKRRGQWEITGVKRRE